MSVELSLCVCIWNTSHLLRRSVQTFLNQDIDLSRWELIVIDDNSQDDVEAALEPLRGKIQVQYRRLEHSHGMRGCTLAFNTAFAMAKGHIIAETTGETLLPKDAIRQMLIPHGTNPRCFISLKTYLLSREMQRLIDTVDWQSDIMNISKLPGWDSRWCWGNKLVEDFKTHMVCSIRKDVFYEITNGRGFPLFADYGCEDPWYAGRREAAKVQGITLPNSCMGIHQWHAPWQYWMSKGRAPNLNRLGHSMSNYMNDKSGIVPDGGTCMIWDHGSHDQITQDETERLKTLDADVIGSGVPEQIVYGGNDVRVKRSMV